MQALQKIKYVYWLCKKREQEGHLPAFRQCVEIAILQLSRGIGYDIYHKAGMWEKSASWKYKCSFLSYKNYSKKVYEINQRKYHGVSQFKPMEKAFFYHFNIPTAKYIGTFQEQWGSTSDGAPLRCDADLERCLSEFIGGEVCFKLVEGFNGQGFKAFTILKENDRLSLAHLVSKKKYSVSELIALIVAERSDGWLIEEYIEQHPVLRAFNPTSLNTVRMFVFRTKDGAVEQLRSFLKTGKSGALIDKTENGGAAVTIDRDTGLLLEGFDWSPEMKPLSEHPTSKVSFKGTQIPYWKEAEAMAIRALRAYPGTRFVGVDIGITPNGPLMVEMNVLPDADCMAVLRIPTAIVFDS